MKLLLVLFKQAIYSLLLFILVSLLIFALVYYSPPTEYTKLYEGDVQKTFGGFVKEYTKWVKGVAQFNLGRTFDTDESISKLIKPHIKETAILVGLALLFSSLFTFIIISFVPKIKIIKIKNGIFSFFTLSSLIPTFVLSYIFIFQIFKRDITFNALSSSSSDRFFYYLIPAMILGVADGFLGEMIRYSKEELSSINQEGYILLAKAKGAKIWKHKLNSFIIFISRIVSSRIITLISASVIVECIFKIQGIGYLAFESAEKGKKQEMLAVAIIIVIVVLFLNFLNKIVGLLLDPRLRD